MTQLSDETMALMTTILEETYSGEHLPAVSAIVCQGQEILWSQSYGYADLGSERPANADTIYHLGSITKIFTAVMLMQLRDAGKLQLDDLVTHYLPELSMVAYPPITLRHLVSHTAGFPVMPPLDDLQSIMQIFPPVLEDLRNIRFPTIEAIIENLGQVELLGPPGGQLVYSNLGIALLAHAMERIAEQSYTAYVESEILAPLGMDLSGFLPKIAHSAHIATCYLPFSDPPEAAPVETKMIEGFTPTGALWSSANDMARFLACLANPHNRDSAAVLAQGSKEEMLQLIAPVESSRYTGKNGKSGVGLGWFLSHIHDFTLAEHGGADPSTAAYIGWVPELQLAAFVATNTGKNPTAIATCAYDLLEFATHGMLAD